MFPSITALCQKYETEFSQIPTKRKRALEQLSSYISNKLTARLVPQIIIICTHNSRRSHLGQIWLSVAADYYQLSKIETFSGGTAATAFNPRAVAAMNRIGFNINNKSATDINPKYEVKWNKIMPPCTVFSKKYNDSANPQNNFAAIMVCDEADAACPFVSGNDFRLALPYDDPKAYDDTPLESEKYEERCHQIGREMIFVIATTLKSNHPK